LLPLAQIAVDTDLLAAIAKRTTDTKLEDLSVSLISIFELQAKAAKLKIPAKAVIRAVDAIISAFQVVPFYEHRIIELSQELRATITDYIDCILVATAISSKQDLITEDSLILEEKTKLFKAYKLRVSSFRDLVSR
jgi:PIN domain nuclease of toxin-antitoxin system